MAGINKDKVRALAEFEVSIYPEEISPDGCFATGDDDADREIVDGINERLDRGDLWAWCFVRVTARFGPFEGSDSLGGCSYEDRAGFEAGGYYEDMKEAALDDLCGQMEDARRTIQTVSA